MFLTGWPVVALFFPGYLTFGVGAHPKLGERAGVDGHGQGFTGKEGKQAGVSYLHLLCRKKTKNPQ